MRKLKLFEHISLDGVIQHTPEDGFTFGDWTAAYRSSAGAAMVLEEYGENYDLLLGRKTYDGFANYWPKAPKMPMSDRFNAATKFVVTHRPESLQWGPFEALTDLVEGVRRIKSSGNRDLILVGSSTLTSALLAEGLADEILLLVIPVLIGKGKRFFAEGTNPRSFELLSSKTSPTGILINKYKFVGGLKNLE